VFIHTEKCRIFIWEVLDNCKFLLQEPLECIRDTFILSYAAARNEPGPSSRPVETTAQEDSAARVSYNQINRDERGFSDEIEELLGAKFRAAAAI